MKNNYQKDKPKLTGDHCTQCGKTLNEYHAFFGKDKCSDCEPIYLLNQIKNKINADQTNRLREKENVDNGNKIEGRK